jgi:hypothetical protein
VNATVTDVSIQKAILWGGHAKRQNRKGTMATIVAATTPYGLPVPFCAPMYQTTMPVTTPMQVPD